jgi:hypothetical protein
MSRLVPFVLEPKKSSNMPDHPVRNRFSIRRSRKNVEINVAIFVSIVPALTIWDRTYQECYDAVNPDSRVIVSELVPVVIDWNRGPLASLARRPLEDRRVEVRSGSVIALGLWSADRSTAFENTLSDAGFKWRRVEVDARGDDGGAECDPQRCPALRAFW